MCKCIGRLPDKVMGIAFRSGDLKGVKERLPVSQNRFHGGCEIWIVSMTQRRLKGVLFALAGEVIAARTKITRGERHTLREFPLHIEVVLHRVGELRVVSCREGIKGQGLGGNLRVEKLREDELLHIEEWWQHTVESENCRWDLVAIDAKCAPHQSFAVTEDVPRKACLRRQKIRRCAGKYLAHGRRGIRRRVSKSRETAVRFGRIGVEIVAQPNVCGEATVYTHKVLNKTRRESFAVAALGVSVRGTDSNVRKRRTLKEKLE